MRREDMTAAAKFRTTCDRCGKRQPRPTTASTSWQWAERHEREHRRADRGQTPGTE
jgi:hypothetical protein